MSRRSRTRAITFVLCALLVLATASKWTTDHQPPPPFHSNGILVHFK